MQQTFFERSALLDENLSLSFLTHPVGAQGQRTMFVLASLESS